KGNKQQEQEEKDKHFYRIERHYGSFERVLAIPDDAETNKITASMKNGVLTIDIPRKEMPATEAKRITIES
ncbi:MAG: Hsp20 family protein, partial [Thioalkalispiraceae bacterium]